MSTRCDIIIRDNKPSGEKIKLFHRLDGYPQGVGKFLIENVLKKLKESPNFKVNEVANFLVKNKEDEDYMITTGRHPDIEYRYLINVDTKEIKCWKVHYKRESDTLFSFYKDYEVNLEDEILNKN